MQRDTSLVVIDHISLGVSNLRRNSRFYDAVLSTLGIGRAYKRDTLIAYSRNRMDDFSIHLEEGVRSSLRAHFAFLAPSRAAGRAFYDVALAAGGLDDGPPGLRPRYHPNYYAAFVTDPDGHRVEAVRHAPQPEPD